MAADTALEPAAKTPAVITTKEEYRSSMRLWGGNYNVLTPFSDVSGIAASFGIIASVVKINTDIAAGEVYSGTTPDGRPAMPFLKGKRGEATEEFALAKIGLRKIAECGGISTSTERTDPRTIPHYWEFKAKASYRGLDGSTITREATFEWDLRDGSDRMKGWSPNQITEGRKNGLRACEARAINAAIRDCGCGIKQKYTRAELEKPFLVVRVAFQPDMSDPAIKQMVTQQALGGVSTMYPSTSSPALVNELPEHGADEPRHVGSGSTQPQTQAKEPDPDTPPTVDAVRIVKTDPPVTGTTNGRAWTRYDITDSRGVMMSTFSQTVYEAAQRFEKSRAWVEITTQTKGQHTNIVEIIPAGSEPALPGMDGL